MSTACYAVFGLFEVAAVSHNQAGLQIPITQVEATDLRATTNPGPDPMRDQRQRMSDSISLPFGVRVQRLPSPTPPGLDLRISKKNSFPAQKRVVVVPKVIPVPCGEILPTCHCAEKKFPMGASFNHRWNGRG